MTNKSESSPSGLGNSVSMYELKITLAGIQPGIWRSLLVRGDTNLGLLHAIFQVAMGWKNSHLHQSVAGYERYGDPATTSEDLGEHDENKTTLREIAPRRRSWFVYDYDFGDAWEHLVAVEKIHAPEVPPKYFASCLDGRRACPPEDCGGIWGYVDFLKAIKSSRHPKHLSILKRIGGKFDPEAFDLENINHCLRKLKWPHTTVSQLAAVLRERDTKLKEVEAMSESDGWEWSPAEASDRHSPRRPELATRGNKHNHHK
jgi:Plasmid pRiA4b ORF-3-like protein